MCEADESDGICCSSNLRTPDLNIDKEHLDYYESFDAISAEFQAFADQTSDQVFYCADDLNLVELFAGRENAVSYGFNPLAMYRLELPEGRKERAFEVWRGEQFVGEFQTRLFGEKNGSNAGAVVAFLTENHFSADSIGLAIGQFGGAQRRQQMLFETPNTGSTRTTHIIPWRSPQRSRRFGRTERW